MITFQVGDKVQITRTLWQEATGDLPLDHLADAGDVVVIRKLRLNDSEYPYSVSHEHITDRSFRVSADEIKPNHPAPAAERG